MHIKVIGTIVQKFSLIIYINLKKLSDKAI